MMQMSQIRAQRGVGLLEVLIALLVLAVGVLGFAGLQMTALSQSDDANHRIAAVLIAQDAIERLELNPIGRGMPENPADPWGTNHYQKGGWVSGEYGDKPDADCIGKEAACNAKQLAEWDIAQLSWQAANQLPGGRILADECAFNTDMTCVIVSWGDQDDPADCMTATGINIDKDSNCLVMEVAR